MTILERFLKYISIDTTSDSNSKETPSTKKQYDLAKLLYQELFDLGITDVYFDKEHCYLYAVLKGDEYLPKVGFISHLDTSESSSGKNIKPQIIDNYDGTDIILKNNVITKVEVYPDLKNHIGKKIITSDGTTLLGADDKAGIAEIMNMLEHFSTTKEKHGDIYVAFTPDEEIGKGTDYFDLSKFLSPIAYTVDGDSVGEISYENFNAANAKIEIKGKSTHAGRGKGIMINASLIANAIISSLPNETPANTEGYEGFYHLKKISGNVTQANLEFLIRDFDQDKFIKRKELLTEIVEKLNDKYENRIKLTIEDEYENMYSIIKENMSVVDIATKAMEKVGVTPIITPIRGGTDGANLTYKGLPCPNIGTGGHNFHEVNEYITLEDMEKASEVLISIVSETTNRKQLKK